MTTDPTASDSRGRAAFLTGTLAAPSLRRVLGNLAAEIGLEHEIIELRIAVAALMTVDWVLAKLELPEGLDRVVVPGYLRGDLARLEEATGVRFERGPKDLRDLPRHLGGRAGRPEDYGAHDIEIVAEINHVPDLSEAELLAEARRSAEAGADIIDLGCNPGEPFAALASRVELLREHGLRVSVDSLDPREITAAVAAGAELVLSVNGSNLDVARDLDAEFVVIPDSTDADTWLRSLRSSVEQLRAWGVRYRIDPVLEPIGFGFATSLGRYLDVRQHFPDDAVLMGIGNLTELTDADSAAINVVLLGFCQEIGVRSVLTTSVIHWARDAVRETDLARRLVHWAVQNRSLPKRLEPDLHLLRDDDAPAALEAAEIEQLSAAIRDRNFRILTSGDRIHVLARDTHIEGDDPFAMFERMAVRDPAHAFYLGYEMAKAITAVTLGKRYTQDEALRWGFLTREEGVRSRDDRPDRKGDATG